MIPVDVRAQPAQVAWIPRHVIDIDAVERTARPNPLVHRERAAVFSKYRRRHHGRAVL
jgi:hypothetical protein